MPQRIRQGAFHGLMAAAFIMGAFALTQLVGGLWITSLGASAFIATVFPGAESARARHLIGGYAFGSFFGVLCCLGRRWLVARPHPEVAAGLIFCTVAVFFTAALMSATGLAHPPSVALSIAITLDSRPLVTAACAMGAICLLCLFKAGVARRLEAEKARKEPDKQ